MNQDHRHADDGPGPEFAKLAAPALMGQIVQAIESAIGAAAADLRAKGGNVPPELEAALCWKALKVYEEVCRKQLATQEQIAGAPVH